jgi:hypothetical protein
MKVRAKYKVSTDKVDRRTRSGLYAGFISLVVFAALVIAPTPAVAGSDFAFGLHVSDGYYRGSSIFFGFGPQVFLPYGYYVYDNHYYDRPFRSHRGHGYGHYRGYWHKDRFERRHNRGHTRDNHRRDNHRRGNRHGRW